jgi:hypothetical protein
MVAWWWLLIAIVVSGLYSFIAGAHFAFAMQWAKESRHQGYRPGPTAILMIGVCWPAVWAAGFWTHFSALPDQESRIVAKRRELEDELEHIWRQP